MSFVPSVSKYLYTLMTANVLAESFNPLKVCDKSELFSGVQDQSQQAPQPPIIVIISLNRHATISSRVQRCSLEVIQGSNNNSPNIRRTFAM
jgi:hypothetical protein